MSLRKSSLASPVQYDSNSKRSSSVALNFFKNTGKRAGLRPAPFRLPPWVILFIYAFPVRRHFLQVMGLFTTRILDLRRIPIPKRDSPLPHKVWLLPRCARWTILLLPAFTFTSTISFPLLFCVFISFSLFDYEISIPQSSGLSISNSMKSRTNMLLARNTSCVLTKGDKWIPFHGNSWS
jgi:hypothetical protein